MRKNILRTVTILLLIVFTVSGCGGAANSSNTGDKNNTTTNNSANDVAIYAINIEPMVFWDPSDSYSNEIIVLQNMYETLLKYDPDSDKIIPVLAESYTKSDDGLKWTFKIRQGVKFHDGNELDAQSVKDSIDRTIKRGKGASFIWDPVKEITVKDKYTVEFDLKYAAPLDLIASGSYAAYIFDAKAAEENGDDWFGQGHDLGTGPYTIKEWKQGDSVLLTKFNDYWQGWDGKHVSNVLFKVVPESSTARQMLESSQLDFVGFALPVEDIEEMKKNVNIEIAMHPSFENLIAFYNTQKAPLDNELVRKAISYTIPYDNIVSYVKGGYATKGSGPIPKGMWGHRDDLGIYDYNLDKAKELLAQAGYPDGGFKLQITVNSGDESERKVAELWKAELAKVGVDLEIQIMPWDAQWALAKSTKPTDRQDILVMYWWPDICDPYSWLKSLFYSENEIVFNMSYFSDPEYDKLVDEAHVISGVDRDKAAELYGKAQEILVNKAIAINIYDGMNVWAKSTALKGYKDNPAYPRVVFFYDTYKE